MTTDGGRLLRTVCLLLTLGVSAALSACATPIVRSGDSLPAPSGADSPTFYIAEAPPGHADHMREAIEAVQAALERRNYREASDGRYRLEVAFSVSRLGLQSEEETGGSQRPNFVLCRQRLYRLTVALLDARDGAVAFRGVASDRRCGSLDPGRLSALAEAALSNQP